MINYLKETLHSLYPSISNFKWKRNIRGYLLVILLITWLFFLCMSKKGQRECRSNKTEEQLLPAHRILEDQPWKGYEVSIQGALRDCSPLVNREGSCPLLLPSWYLEG